MVARTVVILFTVADLFVAVIVAVEVSTLALVALGAHLVGVFVAPINKASGEGRAVHALVVDELVRFEALEAVGSVSAAHLAVGDSIVADVTKSVGGQVEPMLALVASGEGVVGAFFAPVDLLGAVEAGSMPLPLSYLALVLTLCGEDALVVTKFVRLEASEAGVAFDGAELAVGNAVVADVAESVGGEVEAVLASFAGPSVGSALVAPGDALCAGQAGAVVHPEAFMALLAAPFIGIFFLTVVVRVVESSDCVQVGLDPVGVGDLLRGGDLSNQDVGDLTHDQVAQLFRVKRGQVG